MDSSKVYSMCLRIHNYFKCVFIFQSLFTINVIYGYYTDLIINIGDL